MNVCCIYSTENYVSGEKPLKNFSEVHIGLTYIVTVIKQADYHVQLLVFTPHTHYERLLQETVTRDHPQLFCLTAATPQYQFICEIAKKIRKLSPLSHIILGGPHATLNPESTMQEGCFDAICLGEGEFAVTEYARQIRAGTMPAHIPNLWIRNRDTGDIEKNQQAPFITDLDALPAMDMTLWEDWIAYQSQLMTVLVGRGCPNKCAYCSNHALAKLGHGSYVRFRSPENVIREIQQLIAKYPAMKGVYLRAETFSVNLNYTIALCEQLTILNKRLAQPLSYIMCFSPHSKLVANDQLFQALKAANVAFVNMALESGSERIRRDILRRPRYTNQDVIQFCQRAKQFNIHVSLCNMMGLPDETLADFKETVACVRECQPYHAHLYIFYPYPGTDLYGTAKEMGLFSGEIVNPIVERKIARLRLPGFPRWQIQREFFLFYYHIFKGHRPFYQIAGRIVREMIFMNSHVNALFKKFIVRKYLHGLIRKISTDPKNQFLA